jgi:hypothetical protein
LVYSIIGWGSFIGEPIETTAGFHGHPLLAQNSHYPPYHGGDVSLCARIVICLLVLNAQLHELLTTGHPNMIAAGGKIQPPGKVRAKEDKDIRFQTCIQALSNAGLIALSGEFTIVRMFGRKFL